MTYRTTVISVGGKRSFGGEFDAPSAVDAVQYHKSNIGYSHGDMILAENVADDSDRFTCEPCQVDDCYRSDLTEMRKWMAQ